MSKFMITALNKSSRVSTSIDLEIEHKSYTLNSFVESDMARKKLENLGGFEFLWNSGYIFRQG